MFAQLRTLDTNQRSAVIAAFLGWTLDAFDFFLLTFVMTDLAKDFHVQIAGVAEALFLTLAMRPVGALLFGILAERFGRKPVLMVDILLFSVIELASAFSTSIGMFLVLRAMFGVAMGGEWGLGASLAFETIPTEIRGLVSGILQQGYAVGNLLAAVVFWTLHDLIGWRGMFVVGVLPALVVVYVRLHVKESPAWEATRHRRQNFFKALRESVQGRWGLFFYMILLMTCFTALSHGSQDLFPTYLRVQHNLSTQATSILTVIANVGAITGGVLFGLYSERLGRRRAIIIASLLVLLAIYPWAFSTSPVWLALGAFLMQVMVQGAWGIVPVHLNELAPEGTRGTFPGFTYQLGNLLASRNQVFQARFAVAHGNNYGLALALLTAVAAIVLALVTWLGPEKKGVVFADDTGRPLTIPALLSGAAKLWRELPAIEEDHRSLSYGALNEECRRVAAAFIGAGLQQGGCVAIWAPNSAEWVVCAVAVQMAGGVIVPLNTRFKGKEAGYILRRAEVRMLVTVQEFLGIDYMGLLADEMLPALQQVILLSGADARYWDWPTFLRQAGDVSRAEVESRIDALTGEDLADIMFTSGTTGNPKGVMSSHRQNLRAFRAWNDCVGLREGDRYLIVNPFFHSMGYKAGWLACFIQGATVVPMAVFDADELMQKIQKHRITVLTGAPTIFHALLDSSHRQNFDLSSLRLSVTGAASVPSSLIHKMHTELGFQDVLTGYGLTESSGVATMCRLGDGEERVARTCGAPIPGVEVRCVDAAGNEVPCGKEGEVYIRGYNVMRGYLGDTAATAETIDADGWLHSGDIGVMDEQGYLRITDRKKDIFIVGGFNCYPAEIEKIIAEHPAVAQVAVIGVPDERLGEVGRAYVILRQGAALDEAQLIAWCRTNMANYKVPRSAVFVDSLPTTASGKVQRVMLRRAL
jgi:putative sialic acid transporter